MDKKRTKTKQAQNEAPQANGTQAVPLYCSSVAHIVNANRDHLSSTVSASNLALQSTVPDVSSAEKDATHFRGDTHSTVMNSNSYTGIYRDAETAARATRPDSFFYAQPRPEASAMVPVVDTDVLIYGHRTPEQREKDKILAKIISTNWHEAQAIADEMLRLYQHFDMVEMYQYLERHNVSPIVVFELLMRADSAAMSETRRRAAVARHKETVYAKDVKPHVLKQFDVYLASMREGAPKPDYKNKTRFIEAMQEEVKLLFPNLPELTSKAISEWLKPRKAEFPLHWPRREKKRPAK